MTASFKASSKQFSRQFSKAVSNAKLFTVLFKSFHLKYYFQRHVCVSIRTSVRVSEDQLQFLQANHKMSLIKVVPYVLGVDPWGPGCSQTQNVPAQRVLSSGILFKKMKNICFYRENQTSCDGAHDPKGEIDHQKARQWPKADLGGFSLMP